MRDLRVFFIVITSIKSALHKGWEYFSMEIALSFYLLYDSWILCFPTLHHSSTRLLFVKGIAGRFKSYTSTFMISTVYQNDPKNLPSAWAFINTSTRAGAVARQGCCGFRLMKRIMLCCVDRSCPIHSGLQVERASDLQRSVLAAPPV